MATKRGRPSTYTPEVAAEICARISSGDSVRTICADEGMPEARTIFRWLANYEDFRHQYAHARESRADARFESIDQVIEDMRLGVIDAQQARVQIDTIKWQAGKESAKRYGDRLELAGDKDAPIQTRVEIVVVDSPKVGE
jgi:transposase-like protein